MNSSFNLCFDFVRYKPAAFGHLAQAVARGINLGADFFGQQLSLGPLARPRTAQKDDVHKSPFPLPVLLLQKTLIISHQQLCFKLAHGLQADSDDD